MLEGPAGNYYANQVTLHEKCHVTFNCEVPGPLTMGKILSEGIFLLSTQHFLEMFMKHSYKESIKVTYTAIPYREITG